MALGGDIGEQLRIVNTVLRAAKQQTVEDEQEGAMPLAGASSGGGSDTGSSGGSKYKLL